MIKTIIVEDHSLIRFTLKTALTNAHTDIQVVGEAESGAELFRLLETTTPDIILLDIALPDISGIVIARRLKKERPKIKILAISAEKEIEVVQSLLDIGIEGFISKQSGNIEEIINAIHSIMNGVEYFGKDIAALIYAIYVSRKKTTEITPEFTAREREIILLCRDGLVAKEIADRLCISLNTVHNHKKNIFQKLGINSTLEMVQYALRHRIINIS